MTLYPNNVNDIREMSPEPIDMIHNGFIFGYAQGHKAAKAEMKEDGWKNPNKVTIAELIETLQTLDQESIVINYWDRNINYIPEEKISLVVDQ